MFDGTPRRLIEAQLLDSVMGFFRREKPHLFFLNVSREWAREKLIARGRHDDSLEDVERRLAWYETEVVPAIGFYHENADYVFHNINGEQKIEKVHADIISQTA